MSTQTLTVSGLRKKMVTGEKPDGCALVREPRALKPFNAPSMCHVKVERVGWEINSRWQHFLLISLICSGLPDRLTALSNRYYYNKAKPLVDNEPYANDL